MNKEMIYKLIDMMELPSYVEKFNWKTDDSDTLRSAIKESIFNQYEGANIAVHLCNRVAKLLRGRTQIGYSYEDQDIYSMREAQRFFEAIDGIAPGAFVLVTTGDYIHCSNLDSLAVDLRNETYDPCYSYYLVQREIWESQKEHILRRDAQWREVAQKKADSLFVNQEV